MSRTERRKGECKKSRSKPWNSRSTSRNRLSTGRHACSADTGSPAFSSVFTASLVVDSAMSKSSSQLEIRFTPKRAEMNWVDPGQNQVGIPYHECFDSISYGSGISSVILVEFDN